MKKITVTTSIELSDEKKDEIIAKLEKKYGKADYAFHVDYDLIGGIMLFDGDGL